MDNKILLVGAILLVLVGVGLALLATASLLDFLLGVSLYCNSAPDINRRYPWKIVNGMKVYE